MRSVPCRTPGGPSSHTPRRPSSRATFPEPLQSSAGARWNPKENRAYNYYGRGNTPLIAHTEFSNCSGAYHSGDSYFHNYSSNQTYAAGLTVFSISLSSQAGYVSTAQIRFNFTGTGNVCGSNSKKGEDSPRVEASA